MVTTAVTTNFSWIAKDLDSARALAEQWLTHRSLRDLALELGGPSPSLAPDELADIVAWSRKVFDTRAGAERPEVAERSFDDRTRAAVRAAAGPLGLLDTRSPSLDEYGVTVVLGGTTTGNVLRTRLVRTLRDHGLGLGLVIGLTAARPLTPSELLTTRGVGETDTEGSHLRQVIENELGPCHTISMAATARTGGHVVLVAPSRPGQPRPNTRDAVRYLLDTLPLVVAGSCLLVTSAIYAPYQFFTVAPLLCDGTRHVELVGTPTAVEASDRQVQRIAQELHAAITAAADLLVRPTTGR